MNSKLVSDKLWTPLAVGPDSEADTAAPQMKRWTVSSGFRVRRRKCLLRSQTNYSLVRGDSASASGSKPEVVAILQRAGNGQEDSCSFANLAAQLLLEPGW